MSLEILVDPAARARRQEAHLSDEQRPYRVLPYNEEAEQGLLGALLVDNRALEKVSDFLKFEHFYVPAHQRIYRAITTLVDRGLAANPVTLKGYFEKDEDLSDIGGAGYLADLAAGIVSTINTEDYARTIYDLFLRRELITIGEEVVNEAFDQNLESDAQNMIETAESRLFSLAETGQIQGGFVTLRDSVNVAIEHAQTAFKSDGHITGVTTGLRDLDKLLGGFQKSDLLILAGRPSMGKTALATNIAFNAAQAYADNKDKGAVVGFFSLEMSSDQLATRILADCSNISGDAIRKGDIKQEDFRAFVEASQRLSQVPLFIDDTPALSISAVRTRARRLKRQQGLSMIVVDYLQLLRGNGSRQGQENRVLEISEITRGLKAIAKELEIPVLALSQLSRAVEQREDKRPMLSDLRESGSIEQDADVVMFVFREEYYESRKMPNIEDSAKYAEWQDKMAKVANIGECIIAKQRHGPIGTVRMHFDGRMTRFRDLDTVHDPASY
ncbi:MAG: replicative DNA helicase [Alphaproteobacteria bacterium]|nr:replicative DNA helicase [Alphaproteobacteria bacterium]